MPRILSLFINFSVLFFLLVSLWRLPTDGLRGFPRLHQKVPLAISYFPLILSSPPLFNVAFQGMTLILSPPRRRAEITPAFRPLSLVRRAVDFLFSVRNVARFVPLA